MTWTTPDLCDAYPEVQVAEPLLRDFGGSSRFHGRIVTIQCFEDNSRVRELVAQDGHGKVLVVDGQGSLHKALLGDMLGEAALKNGWRGVLVHGSVRDVDVLATLPLGVKALAATPRKAERLGQGQVDLPVSFAGVDFVPGHWLYADANGVIVSSSELAMD